MMKSVSRSILRSCHRTEERDGYAQPVAAHPKGTQLPACAFTCLRLRSARNMSQALDVMLDVVTEMTGAFGEPPRVSEVVEVVGMAIPVGDDRLALLVIPSSLVVRRAGKAASGRSSRVGRLDDATFVL